MIGHPHRRRCPGGILVHRGDEGFPDANGREVDRLGPATPRKGTASMAEHEVRTVHAEPEAARDSAPPDTARGERRSRTVVQSVRLREEDFAAIERLADDADVPVSALIRGWILAGLTTERGTSLRDAIDHLAGEAERLRRLAARIDDA
ncbi:hypothetical protein GCM10023094_00340 [Rhodococcus olei]|uniref:Ribbon-helix-helix CopG family protein n=1 Tax=Rhodococcus olei TaxID=2161675 RepID=A0ABP8NS21_9NOCA